MSFMISRETDNVRSMAEVEGAFRAITARGDKPYVTRDELLQVLAYCSECMAYCTILVVVDPSIGTATRTSRVLYEENEGIQRQHWG